MTDDKKIDYILRTVEERDIRYLRLCFTDVQGNLKALSISPEELEEALRALALTVPLSRASRPMNSLIFWRFPM